MIKMRCVFEIGDRREDGLRNSLIKKKSAIPATPKHMKERDSDITCFVFNIENKVYRRLRMWGFVISGVFLGGSSGAGV